MTEDQQITWFAGLFEGEGTFCFSKGVSKRLSIQMTDQDVLLKVQNFFGGNLYFYPTKNEKWKSTWVWSLGTEKSVELVKKIVPFLGERRKARAEEFIANFRGLKEYSRQRKAKTLITQEEVKRLREKGLKHREIAETLGLDRTSVSHLLGKRYENYGG